jgi:hypothetical protein
MSMSGKFKKISMALDLPADWITLQFRCSP